ncbi:unnamed protein product [Amoebophrya sp. A25]|nr:unnamed protein product [Amoebophrya sp. A25]|eukprot:GSA25T00013673001.1
MRIGQVFPLYVRVGKVVFLVNDVRAFGVAKQLLLMLIIFLLLIVVCRVFAFFDGLLAHPDLLIYSTWKHNRQALFVLPGQIACYTKRASLDVIKKDCMRRTPSAADYEGWPSIVTRKLINYSASLLMQQTRK